MSTFIITITELGEEPSSATSVKFHDTEHYRRRIQTGSVQGVIDALDKSLKEMPPPRKTRSDAGKKKGIV